MLWCPWSWQLKVSVTKAVWNQRSATITLVQLINPAILYTTNGNYLKILRHGVGKIRYSRMDPRCRHVDNLPWNTDMCTLNWWHFVFTFVEFEVHSQTIICHLFLCLTKLLFSITICRLWSWSSWTFVVLHASIDSFRAGVREGCSINFFVISSWYLGTNHSCFCVQYALFIFQLMGPVSNLACSSFFHRSLIYLDFHYYAHPEEEVLWFYRTETSFRAVYSTNAMWILCFLNIQRWCVMSESTMDFPGDWKSFRLSHIDFVVGESLSMILEVL